VNVPQSQRAVSGAGARPPASLMSCGSPRANPSYDWLPTEDISGLPLANFALQTGQHPTGYTPTPK
jgi:hypothetical protein